MRLPRTLSVIVALLLASTPVLWAEPAAQPALLSKDSLLAALTRDLTAHYNLEGELQLESLRPWTPPLAAAGWTVRVLDYPPEPATAMLVRCQIQGDGGAVTESTLLLRAALWREVWVVHLPLTVGVVFDPSRLEPRRSDLLRERDLVPATEGDRTYVFARAVPPGRPLTWHDIAHRPLVRKGDLVVVTAVDGLLVVAMKGLAMESGTQGDTITVRNLDSRKDFPALVTDENHVQIRF